MIRKFIAIIAWFLFGAIIIGTLFHFFMSWGNLGPDQNLFALAGDIGWKMVPIEFAFLSAMIVSRQPGNVIGWLLMLPAIALGSDFLDLFFNFAAAPAAPTPAFMVALWFDSWSWLLLIFPILFIICLFPTGRPASSRWRWVSLYLLGVNIMYYVIIAFGMSLSPADGSWSVANPVGFIPKNLVEGYLAYSFGFGLLSATLLCVISMVARYRHASFKEREQIKWLLFACCLFASIYIPAIFINLNSETWGEKSGWINLLLPFGIMIMPAAIGIAILRHRLWDIDLLIRRTLVYTILTTLLALVYFGSVTLIQNIFSRVSGEQSTVAIVISTLLIAALFTPSRRRVQDFINHRFYRRKYDSQKILEEFSSTARNETNIERLGDTLLQVTEKTIQPSYVSLWLKPAGNRKDKVKDGLIF